MIGYVDSVHIIGAGFDEVFLKTLSGRADGLRQAIPFWSAIILKHVGISNKNER
jgi:hypothetical protein